MYRVVDTEKIVNELQEVLVKNQVPIKALDNILDELKNTVYIQSVVQSNNLIRNNIRKKSVKAMEITRDILSKPCPREFAKMISNVVKGTLCFHTETGTIEGNIGDYIVYEDGDFRIYSSEHFHKYYTKEI